ncbi:signal peptidase I [Planctomycetota bacterium]|nr:signal peptidase I [Planctomycetota bacterium]
MRDKQLHLSVVIALILASWFGQAILAPSMNGLAYGFSGWLAISTGLFLSPLKKEGIWSVSLVAGILALGMNFFASYSVVKVEGQSMIPELVEGDILLIENSAAPKLLDIYVIHGKDAEIVKRLVGTPGDTLDVRYGRMFNDGAEVHPRLGGNPDEWNRERPVSAGYRFGEPLRLNADEYFFLSDNPQHGKDSRQTGPYGWGKVRGRVVMHLK